MGDADPEPETGDEPVSNRVRGAGGSIFVKNAVTQTILQPPSLFHSYSANASKTSSACVSAFTLSKTFLILPSSSIKKVLRLMPI